MMNNQNPFLLCTIISQSDLCALSCFPPWSGSLLLLHSRQCFAEELPFADTSVDLVTAMSAFHWFDRPRFLQEACRVLKPGGCLALLSYTLDMELSYAACCRDTLNQVCREVRRVTVHLHHSAYSVLDFYNSSNKVSVKVGIKQYVFMFYILTKSWKHKDNIRI